MKCLDTKKISFSKPNFQTQRRYRQRGQYLTPPAWELSYVFIPAKSNQAGFDEVLRTNIQSNFYIMKSRLSV